MAYFITRPICLVVMLLVILSIGFAFYLEQKERRKKKTAGKMPKDVKGLFDAGCWHGFSEMTMRQWNFLIGLFLLGMSVFIYIHTRGFPREPRLFPMILLIALFIMSGWLVFQSMALPSLEAGRKVLASWPVLGLMVVTVFTVLYVILVKAVGFYLSTFLFMIGMPFYLRRGRNLRFYAVCVAVAVGFTGVMYLVFHEFLKVPTPVGVLL